MTEKDYKAIAKIINRRMYLASDISLYALESISNDIAIYAKKENHRFNVQKWHNAIYHGIHEIKHDLDDDIGRIEYDDSHIVCTYEDAVANSK